MKPAELITHVVDFLYIKPVRKIIPKQTFRYAVCGGANLVLGWAIYWTVFHFVVGERWLDLGFLVISPATLSLIIQFPFTFLTGFWLNRYVTFRLSPLKGTTQLWRYVLQNCVSLLLKYAALKPLVEYFGVYPTIAIIIADGVPIIASFLMAKFFTFKGKPE